MFQFDISQLYGNEGNEKPVSCSGMFYVPFKIDFPLNNQGMVSTDVTNKFLNNQTKNKRGTAILEYKYIKGIL